MTELRARDAASSRVPRGPRQRWAPLMSVDVSSSDGYAVIVVSGEVDLHTAPELRGALTRLTAGGFRLIVVDLTEVSFMGVSGLAALAAALRSLRPDGSLRVVTSCATTRRLFTITDLDKEIAVYASVGEALEGLPNGSPGKAST